MSSGNNNNIKSKRVWIIVLIIAVLVIAGVLYRTGIFTFSESNQSDGADTQETMSPIDADSLDNGEVCIPLGSNINVIGIGSYMGDYVEDGSDEYVDGVMMITVENEGDQNLQLADIVFNGTYKFELTTLLPGEKMIVLEQNRQTYDASFTITSVDLSNVAVFQEEPSLHKKTISITTSDNKIVVKNVSEKTTAEGKIFYKNHLEDGTFLGGITYCGSIPSLEPGAEVTLSSAHYTVDASEIVFVTLGE